MKKYKGFYFPNMDEDGHPVIVNQVTDCEVVLKYVENKQVCIQAGGNVGVWPAYLSKYFTWVYTFEPDPENYACLLKNLADYTNIIAFNQCLSNTHEKITVGVPDAKRQHNCGALQVRPGIRSAKRIDDLALFECNLIYLDIEGYELNALKGAKETIERCRPVIAYESKSMDGKPFIDQVSTWLENFNYEIVDKIHNDIICLPT